MSDKFNILNNLPDEIKLLPQWILWKLEENKKDPRLKPTKIPYQINGKKAASTRPGEWTSFIKAKRALEQSEGVYQGIGFVFTKDDPYIGIDLDNIIDDYGNMNKQAKGIIDSLDSYTELSQSGTGAHIIIRGRNPMKTGRKSKDKMIEVYSEARFFVVTGEIIEGKDIIQERQKQLEALSEKYFNSQKANKQDRKSHKSLNQTDEEIISRLSNAKNGNKFNALFYNGDISGHGEDHSAADLALCNLIVGYTDDRFQVDRIFKSSALYRDKWDRADYRDLTIEKAFSDRTWCYDPSYYSGGQITDDFDFAGEEGDQTGDNKKGKYFVVLKNASNPAQGYKVNISLLAMYMKENFDIKVFKGQFKLKKKHYYRNVENMKHLISEEIPGTLRAPGHIKDCEELLLMDGELVLREQDLAPPKYISFENGVLNVEKMIFKPSGDPSLDKLIFINSVGYDWNKDAAPDPLVDGFFSSVTNSKQEDLDYLYQILGVLISGYRSFKNIFYFSGVKDSGKSVYLRVAEMLLTAPDGTRDFSNVGLKTLTDETSKEFSRIIGKRANICGESPEIKISNDTLLKQLSGGDTVSAHVKFREPIEFINKAMLLFSGNSVPNFFVSDKSSISERLLIYRFKNAIPKQKQIKNLAEKMSMEYVIVKAIEQLKVFILNNQEFNAPEEIEDNREEMLRDSDIIYKFYKENCAMSDSRKDRISTADLYNYFIKYLVKEGRIRKDYNGEPDLRNLKITQHVFTSNIKKIHGDMYYARNLSYGSKVADCFINITMKSDLVEFEEIDEVNQKGIKNLFWK
ncbi:MAG TPA: hypothetical protein DCG34_08090 [Clostridiales bacterium]|nr:hypothetical protein [Clostridiales bacterium]